MFDYVCSPFSLREVSIFLEANDKEIKAAIEKGLLEKSCIHPARDTTELAQYNFLDVVKLSVHLKVGSLLMECEGIEKLIETILQQISTHIDVEMVSVDDISFNGGHQWLLDELKLELEALDIQLDFVNLCIDESLLSVIVFDTVAAWYEVYYAVRENSYGMFPASTW